MIATAAALTTALPPFEANAVEDVDPEFTNPGGDNYTVESVSYIGQGLSGTIPGLYLLGSEEIGA